MLKAEYIGDYILRLWFEDGMDVSIYKLDFRPLVVEENPGGKFEALKNRERFRQVRGDYALIWPNPETGARDEQAIDIAPECVRFFCEKYGEPLKVSRKVSGRYPLYWVAYFDLLGFKNMVRQNTIWKVLECYAKAMNEIEKKKEYLEIIEKPKWFSDTFILYAKDESRDSSGICGAAAHFFRTMLSEQIPVRGCLAHGGLCVGPRGEMFGPALIDAYEEAEAQDWLGFVLHRTAEERMRHYCINGRSVADALAEYDYIEHRVPFKQRSSHSTKEPQPNEPDTRLVYTIVPLPDAGKDHRWWATLDDMQAEADKQIVKAHDAMACPACENERARVRRKYENSKEFIRDIISKHSYAGEKQIRQPPEAEAGGQNA